MELKIITSNLRYENEHDGPNNWPHRKVFLSDLINKKNPDVLASQEGRNPQIQEFNILLENVELVDSHRQWISERMYPCLYIRSKEMPVVESGDIWLSLTPEVAASKSFGSTFPRLCSWSLVKRHLTGEVFLLVATHLDHVLEETRIEQCNVLINEITKLRNKKSPNAPVIFMGDFNESPDHAIKSNLMRAFNLKDPWNELSNSEQTSHHSFLGEKCLSGHRIDWILIPETFKTISIELLKDKMPNGNYPSDHYPLFLICDTHP